MKRYDQAFSKGGIDIYQVDTGEVIKHLDTRDARLANEFIKQLLSDDISRATRDAAEKFTADAAGKELKPEGFVEYPEDYFDATELQDSDSYRDFVDALNQE